MIEQIFSHVARAVGDWAYLVLGAWVFFDTTAAIGFAFPGEIAVLLGGALAGAGSINILILCGALWVCAYVGDTVNFFLGRKLGRAFLLRHGRRFRITEERLQKVDVFLHRHGGRAVALGRVISVSRPLGPFVAGSSGMPYRRVMPYSLVGTFLWTIGYSMIGYFFWRSFGTLNAVVGKGLMGVAVFAVLVVIVVGIWKILSHPERRQAAQMWLERQGRRPLLRPVAAAVRFVAPYVRFTFNRLTPGELGLEFTTALAAAAVGFYVFVLSLDLLSRTLGPVFVDSLVEKVMDGIRMAPGVEVAKLFDVIANPIAWTALGLILALAFVLRHASVAGAVVGVGALATYGATELVQSIVHRPRPPDVMVITVNSSFPAASAAVSVVVFATLAIVWEMAPAIHHRLSLIVVGLVWILIVGFTSLYLGTSYASDVVGGWGLAFGIYGATAAAGLIVNHLIEIRGEPRPDRRIE